MKVSIVHSKDRKEVQPRVLPRVPSSVQSYLTPKSVNVEKYEVERTGKVFFFYFLKMFKMGIVAEEKR